jgi:glycosyltransferase involved in cell wall biosynthesis
VIAQDLKSVAEFRSLLNAVRHLAIDGYEFMLAIIGTGPATDKIRLMIKKLGLSHVVTLIAQINPLRSVLSGADIFIQLDVDNFPNSQLLEAMSVGMAVASSKDNQSHLLVEDQTAALFDPHDELSIYSTLKKLLGTREFARELAANSQQHIREHHSVSMMADKLIGVYQKSQSWLKTSKETPPEPKSPPEPETEIDTEEQ